MVQSAERLRLPGALGRGDRYLRSYRDLAPRRHYRHRAGSVASRARCRRRQGTARGRGRTSRKRRLDSMTSRIIVAFVAAAMAVPAACPGGNATGAPAKDTVAAKPVPVPIPSAPTAAHRLRAETAETPAAQGTGR